MKNIVATILSAALLTMAGISMAWGISAPLSTPELKKLIGADRKNTLIFFQNPYGGPCKRQKEVLDRLQTDRKGSFNIASVSTMKQEDQKAFYDYGIRSLPSLVLVDKSGKIVRVFPPGIQSIETLTLALNRLK